MVVLMLWFFNESVFNHKNIIPKVHDYLVLNKFVSQPKSNNGIYQFNSN